ncbi:hypothetical protein SS50377_23443 [Spironucleus salmonicida]|uniref:Uncharacterized protein n=1 Tax=Spironucleus salmonicida TaxID=348837 RepID=V6LNK9_9EUKA|nr:hypothetical protein SS50377_23443 [Spironucleus salmonicida]|eukprot:EST46180.1 Hypothetical protein SS50377_13775 [Spironucleus salmonicida]
MDQFRNYHDNILIGRIQSPQASVDHKKPNCKIVKPLHQIHLQQRKKDHDNAYLLDNIVNAKTLLTTYSPIYKQVSTHMRKNNDYIRNEKIKEIERVNNLDKQRMHKVKSSYEQREQTLVYKKSRQILFVRSNSPQKELSKYSSYIQTRQHDMFLKNKFKIVNKTYQQVNKQVEEYTQFDGDYQSFSVNQIPEINYFDHQNLQDKQIEEFQQEQIQEEECKKDYLQDQIKLYTDTNKQEVTITIQEEINSSGNFEEVLYFDIFDQIIDITIFYQ